MKQTGRHKKLCYIECAYWSCSYQEVAFNINAKADRWCNDTRRGKLNLEGHEGSNAPKWCQRRKENGGSNL